MINGENGDALFQVQLYLSLAEARKFANELGKLLNDPEANEHFHLFSEDGGVELSCSIVTAAKLSRGYTAEERHVFGGWKPKP
jgi:hypothetical protein